MGDSWATHAYAVVNYTASSSNPFEVYNPWGIKTAAADGDYGLFSVNATSLSQNFAFQSFGTGAAIGTVAVIDRHSSRIIGSAAIHYRSSLRP